MELVSLTPWHFRNLEPNVVEWAPAANLVFGDNGEGKTNLLEAVAVLGNLRSFFSHHLRRVVRHGDSGFRVEGVIRRSGRTMRLLQVVDVGPPLQRDLKVDGAPVEMAAYLSIFPVFTISSGDRELVAGRPEFRRSFIDRLAFLLEPLHFDELGCFRRTLRQRNAALAGASDAELGAWEGRLAVAAAKVIARRRRTFHKLRQSFSVIYASLRRDDFPDVAIEYRGESWLPEDDQDQGLAKDYEARYNETRARDRLAGFTSEGPHRHDLALRVVGRPARDVLSSGQTKVVAAALRLAALDQAELQRNERIPVIVDDVDAELDPTTLRHLVAMLGSERQLFLSSAHASMVVSAVQKGTQLWMARGSCTRLTTGGESA